MFFLNFNGLAKRENFRFVRFIPGKIIFSFFQNHFLKNSNFKFLENSNFDLLKNSKLKFLENSNFEKFKVKIFGKVKF